MPEPLFVPTGDGTYRPTSASRGPWDPGLLHGGPVAALLAHVLSAGADGAEWFPARLTVDLMRPVALAPLTVTATTLRTGRRAGLVSADARSNGTLVARAALQLVAIRELATPTDGPARRWASDRNESSPETTPTVRPRDTVGEVAFHSTSVEHRSSDEIMSGGGPATDWIRVASDLFEGEPLSAFERVVCAADFTNGVSSALPFDEYTFVNADLTVHVFRLPVDEWVQIDAVTHIGDAGVGLAESRLLDRDGLLGRACQSLVVAPR